jgi:hypothetical protein
LAFAPKVVNGECREFVVLPPEGVQFDEPTLHTRIAEALREAFPDAGFTVMGRDNPLRDDEFTIIPVVEERDGERMSRLPHPDVIAEIGNFLTVNFAGIPAPKLH